MRHFRPDQKLSNLFYFFADDTSLGYSQLKPAATSLRQSVSSASFLQSNANVSTAGDVSRKILRCLSKPSIVSMPKPKPRKKKRNEEMEREWLLLGEPASPRNTLILDNEQDTSSLTITPTGLENTAPSQDVSGLKASISNDLMQSSDSESDSSTDIDAVVDEYRQKVEVTSSGPSEKVLRIPSMESWRLSIVLMSFYFVGVCLCIFAIVFESIVIFSGGILGECSFYVHSILGHFLCKTKRTTFSSVKMLFAHKKNCTFQHFTSFTEFNLFLFWSVVSL